LKGADEKIPMQASTAIKPASNNFFGNLLEFGFSLRCYAMMSDVRRIGHNSLV